MEQPETGSVVDGDRPRAVVGARRTPDTIVPQPETSAKKATPRPSTGTGPAGGPRGTGRSLASAAVWAAALGLTALLVALATRLPWNGDLGVHAAVLERLHTDLLHPGSPMVDAPVASPYYSPWTVLQALFARATGADTFTVLRVAALVNVALLVTGVWRFTRTLSGHTDAPPLALLCLTLLWGPPLFAWSGFLELGSLAITIAYPSTFVIGLSFHFWALLGRAVTGPAGPRVFALLGLLWGVMLLSHQFTGFVATLGGAALLWTAGVGRQLWLRLAIGTLVGAALLVAWPYYSIFKLLGDNVLDPWHAPLYEQLPSRLCLALLGAGALWLRWERNRRDPLVAFFLLGVATVAYGGVSGHLSWGRVLPAVLIPAHIACAIAVVEGHWSRSRRKALAGLLAAALAFGAWTQSTALGYVVPHELLPEAVRAKAWPSRSGYAWAMRWVHHGDTVMTPADIASQLPAHGAYTVAPAYPDTFLPDSDARWAATNTYFSADASRPDRLSALHRYHAAWVLQWPVGQGGMPPDDPALRLTATGPAGEVLFRVVG
ncbi:hypothetical protein ACWC24_34445 [Streptomyces sp. NPDC001443]